MFLKMGRNLQNSWNTTKMTNIFMGDGRMASLREGAAFANLRSDSLMAIFKMVYPRAKPQSNILHQTVSSKETWKMGKHLGKVWSTTLSRSSNLRESGSIPGQLKAQWPSSRIKTSRLSYSKFSQPRAPSSIKIKESMKVTNYFYEGGFEGKKIAPGGHGKL